MPKGKVKIFGEQYKKKLLPFRTIYYDGTNATDIDDVMVCGIKGHPCIKIGDIKDKHQRFKQVSIAKKLFFEDDL